MNKLYLGATSLVSLTALSFAALSSSIALADTSVTSTATVTIAESCTMSGTTDTAHTANLVNGTYSGTDYINGIGQTTLKVFCNDSAGYAIYAIGYTNNEYGNTYLHWNKATSDSDHTADIQTGIYTSGSTTNSTWSMKLAALTGTYAASIDDGNSSHNNSTEDYTTWHEVPDEYERVAYRTTGTDTNDNNNGTGSSITVTYDAYVSTAQPAGSYTGQVKFTMVHPNTEGAPAIPLDPTDCPAYSICYAPNASGIEGDMSSLGIISASAKGGAQTQTTNQYGNFVDITSSTTLVNLIAPNFKREGYGFAGWSTSFDATTANNPVIYGPNESINTDPANDGIDLSTNGLVLYPVWVASTGTIQEWTGCSSLITVPYNSATGNMDATLSSVTALTDSRDDNTYAVARLADGNCWMIENLKLDAEHSRGAENIAKAQGYGTSATYGNFIGLADSEDTHYERTDSPVANSLYSTDGSTTINIGTEVAYQRFPRYNNNNTNLGGTNASGDPLVANYNGNTYTAQWYGYGNYYTWAAAMANTGYPYTVVSDDNTSICPKGWRIPVGGTSVGSYHYLDTQIGGDGYYESQNSATNTSNAFQWRMFPNNIILAGIAGNTNISGRGAKGYYISVSFGSGAVVGAASNFAIYNLTRYIVDPYTGSNISYGGESVRCVLLMNTP